MISIFVHPKTATPAQLLTNGYGRIECTKCEVYEEINADFYATIEVPIGSANESNITGGSILKIPCHRGVQYFRVGIPERDLKRLKAKAWHISYDLACDMIFDNGWTAKTGAEAVAGILSAGLTETRFTGTSDITTLTNLRAVRSSILATLMDSGRDNSVINRWGGEVYRNNFTFNVYSSLGSNNGVKITYRKNLTGFNLKEDWTQISTRIVPTCRSANDGVLVLPEGYINSSRIGDYPYPYMRSIHYSDIKVGADVGGSVPYPTDSSAFAEMRARVAALYAAGVDLPSIEAKIDLVDLSRTKEYAQYSALETVTLGDTVTGSYLGATVTNRVRAVKFDAMKQTITGVTLGNPSRNTVVKTMYSHDIDISVLRDSLTKTVKQTDAYYGVELNHADGVKVTGSSAINNGYAKFNADQLGFYDASGNMVGGMAYIYSRLATIASMLTDDATDPAFWAEVGEVTIDGEVHRGIFGYLANYSLTEPFFKLVATHQTSPENSVFRVMLRDKLELFLKYNPTGMQIVSLGGKYAGTDYMPSIGMVTNSDGSIRSVDITVGTFKGGVDSAGGLYRKDGGGAKSYVT